MKQYPTFRASLIRYATTALTVSLLVTLRVETPCTMPSGAPPGHELHEVRFSWLLNIFAHRSDRSAPVVSSTRDAIVHT